MDEFTVPAEMPAILLQPYRSTRPIISRMRTAASRHWLTGHGHIMPQKAEAVGFLTAVDDIDSCLPMGFLEPRESSVSRQASSGAMLVSRKFSKVPVSLAPNTVRQKMIAASRENATTASYDRSPRPQNDAFRDFDAGYAEYRRQPARGEVIISRHRRLICIASSKCTPAIRRFISLISDIYARRRFLMYFIISPFKITSNDIMGSQNITCWPRHH